MRKYLLLLPFFLSFFMINNTFAVSDITGVINNSSTYTYICHNDDSSYPNCSDYSYFVLTNTNYVFGSNYYVQFDIWLNSQDINYSRFPYIGSFIFSLDNIYALTLRNGSTFGQNTFSYLLTDSINSCPEPEPCPAIPETPYAEKFDNIEKAIYVCGAILIMLYFFYCIYRMIIKGSGVN